MVKMLIYVAFLSNYEPDGDFIRHPRVDSFQDGASNRFPLLCLGSSRLSCSDNVLLTLRNIWKKYERCENYRYYRDYMELFKKETCGFKVKVYPLEEVSEEHLETRLKYYVMCYRVTYGDKCLLSNYRILFDPDLGLKANGNEPENLGPSELRKSSRKKYDDKNRDYLREKSRKYYEANKEILREKRLMKKNKLTSVDNEVNLSDTPN